MISLQHCKPATDSADDAEAASLMDTYLNRGFLDPVLLGRYPARVQADLERLGVWEAGDVEAAHAGLDFLGVNFYGPFYAKAGVNGWELAGAPEEVATTPIGLPDEPDDLYHVLVELRDDYANPTVYISEIGVAEWVGGSDDTVDDDAVMVDDRYRIDFYRRHFAALHRAIADGCDCRGIFAWSLLDNIEWEWGWAVRFGLVKVDSRTAERTSKASLAWYGELATTGQLDVGP